MLSVTYKGTAIAVNVVKVKPVQCEHHRVQPHVIITEDNTQAENVLMICESPSGMENSSKCICSSCSVAHHNVKLRGH